MTTIPPVVPPLPIKQRYARDLPLGAAFEWLRLGWRDLTTHPAPSLLYGLFVFLLSASLVVGLVWLAWDFALFPAIAGFLVFAPALAIGLYDKSRALELGETVSLRRMLLPHARAGGQVLFTGALLCGVMLLWMRAAVIIYALFFGVRSFPGLDHIMPMLFSTPTGVAMLVVGTLIGGLFAAFSFAISAFSLPMMLDKRLDALTAMGTSLALVWNNLATMLVWGAVVLALFLLSVATGFIGLIVIFPWLGHATWHAYRAVR
ncbi:DUF2189 domain-containing protein [Croceicoccus naphthovorans]|uniref:Cytochrome C oxidase subunit I n=1 Tax=Croceicoccus naphthovorans TaxID=1348774 RepID=A0A0G3XC68_9SPHN|nr:DUF2189 domain-containing protein [Croceicoccus naphthovorans]AKM09130.1 cytochrome C oxidase subunit I [Croceicoccus naphthovorans]MBB3991619.1 putative membrane protein [Croceicoccus naphthovorans]